MDFRPFIGGSHQSEAWSADQELTINWYPAKVESPGAVAPMVLLPVPGVQAVGVAYDGVGRGHYSLGGREFACIGDALFEFYEDGFGANFTSGGPGTVGSDTDISPVFIDSNGDLGSQLLIVWDEGAGYADLTTTSAITGRLLPTFSAIAALTGKATMGGYLDGYGLCLDAKTSTLYVSALGDMSSWTTGTDFAQRSLAADPWLSMKVAGRYIWLFGEFTSEIWQDVGTRFPFAPIASSVIDYGIAAQYSAVEMGNNVAWLARHKTGRVCVMLAGGVNPTVISTPAIEYQISTLSDISGAVGDSYSWNGHQFYLLHFDADNVTFVWDSTTGLWHQRGTWDEGIGAFRSWSPRYFVTAFGEIRSLDRMISTDPLLVDSSNTASFVYRLAENFPVDVDGKPLRRVRRSPALVNENERVAFSEFDVFMDSGEPPQKETLGTVSLATQSASIAETTIFTVGDQKQPFVIDWDLRVTTTTTDYALSGNILWYSGGTQWTYYIGQVTEPDDTLKGSLSIVADAGSVVTYDVTYTSTVVGMEYSVDISCYTPGVEDPQAMLRWSDDGGKTWSNEHWESAGKTGQYTHRVNWHRLGTARRRVFELVVSDPMDWKLTAAYMKAEPRQS